MINCALITDDEAFRRHVRSLTQDPGNSYRLILELTESASDLPRERVADVLAADPDVVFVDLGEALTGVRVLEVLAQEAPDVAMIAAGPTLSAEDLLSVIRAGANEYLPRPFESEEIRDAFDRIRRRVGVTRSEDQLVRGEVTTLFSPKGGVGVTTLAVNLGVTLHQLTGKRTLLLDLAPMLGTAALSLGLQPRYSYLDVIQNFHRMDEELFQSFLEVHESGIQVLSSPPRLEDAAGPSMDEVMGLIRFCRRHFSHVIVDAGGTLTSAVEAVLLEADYRFWVSTAELPTLRNVKRTLEIMGDYTAGNGKNPPRIILNQYADGLGVTVDEVEKGLGLEVELVIERDGSLLPESINLGRPAVLMKRSSFSRSMTDLAEAVAGPVEVSLHGKGFLQTLLKPFRSSGPVAATTTMEDE